jgi:hypothetical protein
MSWTPQGKSKLRWSLKKFLMIWLGFCLVRFAVFALTHARTPTIGETKQVLTIGRQEKPIVYDATPAVSACAAR